MLPQLQPGDALVIDKASFHRSQAIEELVAQAGCELWYLPHSFFKTQLTEQAEKPISLQVLKK